MTRKPGIRNSGHTMLLVILAAVALSACGVKGPLEPPPGEKGESTQIPAPKKKVFN